MSTTTKPKPTLADEGIRITSLPHAPFRITHNGRPATLAIIDTETGEVINASPQVARQPHRPNPPCPRTAQAWQVRERPTDQDIQMTLNLTHATTAARAPDTTKKEVAR